MVKVSKIHITNTKIKANNANAAVNAPTVTIIEVRVRNNSANIENTLAIWIAGNYLKKVKKIAA